MGKSGWDRGNFPCPSLSTFPDMNVAWSLGWVLAYISLHPGAARRGEWVKMLPQCTPCQVEIQRRPGGWGRLGLAGFEDL